MKQYRVFIDITVTKEFSLKAESEEQAKEEALRMCRERSDYYARDNDGVVDVSVTDCEEDPMSEEDEERTLLDDGLDYVREQLDADELMIIKSRVSYNMNHRLPAASQVNDAKVIDLLEEYGEDNDLPEGWWMEQGDIDDILLKL